METLLWPASKRAGEGSLTRVSRCRAKGNDFKLEEGRSRLDIRKFFLERVVGSGTGFPVS